MRIDKAIATAKPGDLSGVRLMSYRVRSHDTVMHRTRQRPDGNIWFTELNTDRLGRLVTGRSRGGRSAVLALTPARSTAGRHPA